MMWSLVILGATLAVDLYTDTRPSVKVNHLRGWLLRLIPYAFCIIMDGFIAAPLAFTYWALFDTGYGIIVHRNWLYIGTTAWLDKLQRRYSDTRELKYLFGLIALTGYIIYG